MPSAEQKTKAYVYPFIAFMALMLVESVASGLGLRHDHPDAPWYRQHPEYLMMLLQMVVCFPIIIYWRKAYQWFGEVSVFRAVSVAVVAGLLGIGFWVLPTHLYDVLNLGGAEADPKWYKWLGLAKRDEGFDGAVFQGSPTSYWFAIVARFFRAVVVVALVEEIFWRGFLMRYLIKPDGNYWKVPFGEASWLSWAVVTGAFTLAHAPVDWLGCLVFGSIMYFVAVRTKSLFACVLMHGVANLTMGWYALAVGKYGLW